MTTTVGLDLCCSLTLMLLVAPDINICISLSHSRRQNGGQPEGFDIISLSTQELAVTCGNYNAFTLAPALKASFDANLD